MRPQYGLGTPPEHADIPGSDHDISIKTSGAAPVGNKIYFFKGVTHESISDLCSQLEEAVRSIRTTFCTFPELEMPPIHLYLDSYGGGLFAGLTAFHYLRQLGHPVHAHVTGGVMSAATLILLGCDTRSIGKHAVVLIHQLSTGFWGKHAEMKDEILNMDLLMKQLRAIYKDRTTMTTRQINALLKRDLYLSAEDTQKRGLAHRIE